MSSSQDFVMSEPGQNGELYKKTPAEGAGPELSCYVAYICLLQWMPPRSFRACMQAAFATRTPYPRAARNASAERTGDISAPQVLLHTAQATGGQPRTPPIQDEKRTSTCRCSGNLIPSIGRAVARGGIGVPNGPLHIRVEIAATH